MSVEPRSGGQGLKSHLGKLLLALSSRGAHLTLSEIQPGLPAAVVAAAFDDMGLPGHAQASELFLHVNGSDRCFRPMKLFPEMNLLGLHDTVRVRRDMMLNQARLPTGFGYPAIAGWPAFRFIPEFVPIAEGETHILVEDVRRGLHQGQIIQYDRLLADSVTTSWPNLASYLDDVAWAIETGNSLNGWRPMVEGGTLRWLPSDDR